MGVTEDSTTLRSRVGKGLAVVAWLIGLAVLVSLVVAGHPLDLLRYTGAVLLAGYLAWLAFWSPSVTIAPSGVVIRNLLRSHAVTWPAIQLVDTRFALTLVTPSGKIAAWSAPAPSRYGGLRRVEPELRRLPESTYGPNNTIRPGDIPQSESGLAAYYVRRYWEQLRDAGFLDSGVVEGKGVVTTWLRRESIVLLALVVITIAGAALVR